jgi:hypothetical protein
MELSADMFESTIRSLKGDQVEKRKHPRAPARFKLKIIPYQEPGKDGPMEVWTRDISAGGIGLTSYVRLKVGMRFVVRLPRHEGAPLCLLCTVKNCIEQMKGVYVIGASFMALVAANGTPSPTPARGIDNAAIS